MAPSVIPIVNLKAVICQIRVAKAIPMNDVNVIGAKRSKDRFLPSRSTKFAAKIDPNKHPPKGDPAHHEASLFVVGIEDELDSK